MLKAQDMNTLNLIALVQRIVVEAKRLSDQYTKEDTAPVNYACVFSQSEEEYASLVAAAQELGTIAQDTKMGPVFHVSPISTSAGELRLLKIRRPDVNRPERGDADFTVSNYSRFKEDHVGKSGFRLIEREDMEMMELQDPAFHALAYFSYPTLYEVLERLSLRTL